MYQGQFVNDKREGQGTFVWADGRKYIGEWKAGKQHGVGTYISKDGVAKEGYWKNGRKIKWVGEGEDANDLDNGDDVAKDGKDDLKEDQY